MDDNFHAWKSIPNALFLALGVNAVFHHNLNLPHIECKKIQPYSPFYQQLIGFWEKLIRKEPLNSLEIVSQVIWNDIFLLKQSNSLFYPSLYNKASAKLKFDLKEQDAMLWLSILEFILSQWKRKVKSHDLKIGDDVSAGPSLNMTVKSGYNILLRSVKTCPTSQKSFETFLNNHSINWPEVYMIPQKVTMETSLRVFQYKLLNNIIYLSKRISKFDQAVNLYAHFAVKLQKTSYIYFAIVKRLSSFVNYSVLCCTGILHFQISI